MSLSQFDLTGRTAVITGGSMGIGVSIAGGFARRKFARAGRRRRGGGQDGAVVWGWGCRAGVCPAGDCRLQDLGKHPAGDCRLQELRKHPAGDCRLQDLENLPAGPLTHFFQLRSVMDQRISENL